MVLNADDSSPQATELTARERDVLGLAQRGMTNKQIATELGISRNAVRFHLKDIHSKLETGSQRNALSRGWSRGLTLLSIPAAKLGVPTTVGVFASVLAVTGFVTYREFPAERGDAEPKRFVGTVLVDGRYQNGCPPQFNAGTMTLADFAHGETSLDEMRALNPDIPDGPLPPETLITVPYDPTKTCSEVEPNMTPAALQTPGGTPKAGG